MALPGGPCGTKFRLDGAKSQPEDVGCFGCDERASYDKASSDLAWQRTIAFFKEKLGFNPKRVLWTGSACVDLYPFPVILLGKGPQAS